MFIVYILKSYRHGEICDWLRDTCSTERGESLRMLGLDPSLGRPVGLLQSLILGETDSSGGQSESEEEQLALIRRAYLEKAKQYHPDRNSSDETSESFVAVKKAYEHLTVYGGRGRQCNERHDIKAMISSLAHSTSEMTLEGDRLDTTSTGMAGSCVQLPDEDSSPLMFFKARLLATLLDYGSEGMPASSLRKKWKEIWPDNPFPSSDEMHTILESQSGTRSRNKCKKIKVLSFLKTIASDCCRVEETQTGIEPLLFALETSSSQSSDS